MYARRIHIVPVGGDVERMVEPLVEMHADAAYLLVDEGADANAVAERLVSAGIDVAIEPVDQGSVYAVLGLVTTLAHRQGGNDTVRVNVATGSRLATVGAALACMDEETDAAAYVPAAEDGDAVGELDPVSVVPDYPIESPSRGELATLAVVAVRDTAVHTPKKRELIDEAIELQATLDRGIPFAERIVGNAATPASAVEGFDDLSSDERKGAYRTFREGALADLEARDHVVVDDGMGRGDLVSLTPTGKATLQAFRHKVVDVVRALDRPEMPTWLTDGVEPRAEEWDFSA